MSKPLRLQKVDKTTFALEKCRIQTDKQRVPRKKALSPKTAARPKSKKRDQVAGDVAGLEAFANELVRLARDVTREIDRGRLTPRCLSGLIAMKPLIGLIQDTAFKILRTTAEADSSGDNGDHDGDDVEVASDDESGADDEGSGLTPGYL